MLIKPKVMPADPTKVCKTCGYYDPTLQICCARDMLITKADAEQWTCGDWEENLNVFTVNDTIGMDPVNPVKVPLQPDGSLKMQSRETIGAETVNTDAVVRLQKLCDEAEPCKAKLTFQYQENQQVFGGTSLKELEEKQKSVGWDHRLEAKALDRDAKQGMTLEALDTVFAIACQQVPSMEKRWVELRAEINIMFAQKWAAEDMSK